MIDAPPIQHDGLKLNTVVKTAPGLNHPRNWARVHRLREHWTNLALDNGLIGWDTLPGPGYGANIDERAVELPLALSIVTPGARVFDAGSALNLPYLRQRLHASGASFVHFTQSPKGEASPVFDGPTFSYLFGDLRDLPFKEGWFDRVVCVSTIEHVGMDNRRYGGQDEGRLESAIDVVCELLRVLKPGGQLVITFPYGEPQEKNWLRIISSDEKQAWVNLLAARGVVSERYYWYDGFWTQGGPAIQIPTLERVRETEQTTSVCVLKLEARR